MNNEDEKRYFNDFLNHITDDNIKHEDLLHSRDIFIFEGSNDRSMAIVRLMEIKNYREDIIKNEKEVLVSDKFESIITKIRSLDRVDYVLEDKEPIKKYIKDTIEKLEDNVLDKVKQDLDTNNINKAYEQNIDNIIETINLKRMNDLTGNYEKSSLAYNYILKNEDILNKEVSSLNKEELSKVTNLEKIVDYKGYLNNHFKDFFDSGKFELSKDIEDNNSFER